MPNETTAEGYLPPSAFVHREILHSDIWGQTVLEGSTEVDHEGGEDLELSVDSIAERPRSFDTIQDFIQAAAEENTQESLLLGHAAGLLRDEMHAAWLADVKFQPSVDPEMRDELAEWLTQEVPGLSLEQALAVVGLEGLDFPPLSQSEEATDVAETDEGVDSAARPLIMRGEMIGTLSI